MTAASPIRVLVDADACPVKDEVYRVAHWGARRAFNPRNCRNGRIAAPTLRSL